MTEHTDYKPHIVSLFLNEIFPLCDLSSSEKDNDEIVNAAYRQLFEELIPGFKEDVHFVLAEVLELDKEKSQPRLLVYSNRNRAGVMELLKEYFAVIKSLREDEWSISKADALYTGSRIWCAEMQSAECRLRDEKKKWIYEKMGDLPRSYEFDDDEADEAKELREVEEIRVAFEKYIQALYDLHMKNYPFAYVMLIPIFLGSMYGKKKKRSWKKLGAIFLHFATSQHVDVQTLRRIYGRTLLFWHYYFTSEALEQRQEQADQSRLEKETLEKSVKLLDKIKAPILQISNSLRELRNPLFELEVELNPVGAVLLGHEQTRFFQVGPPIPILNGAREVTPRHDWMDGAVDVYKTLVAAVLIDVLHLEKEVKAPADDLWAQIAKAIDARADDPSNRLFKELTNAIPHLRVSEPSVEQVKETFKVIKSWYSDAFKVESGRGMPLSMLEFAFKAWGCEFEKVKVKDKAEPKTFWVASEYPARTIDALGILHEKQRFHEVSISVVKERGGGGKALTRCAARIGLGEPERKRGNIRRLRETLDDSLQRRVKPGGDMTRFLWYLCGGRQLSLSGTVFSWREGNHEVSLDFCDPTGRTKEIVINWKGEIRV